MQQPFAQPVMRSETYGHRLPNRVDLPAIIEGGSEVEMGVPPGRRKAAHGFLLVTRDPMDLSERTGSAIDLVKLRLERAIWPIYSRTPNRARLAAEDRLAFYVGGSKELSGHIVATGSIRSVKQPQALTLETDPGYLTEPASVLLQLTDITCLKHPINLKDQIARLSICPANPKSWGSALMGGCRALPREDWVLLFGGNK